jgi:O-antigen/teichoic acid export membrane protein
VIKKLNIYLNRKTSLFFLFTIVITSGGNFFVTIFLWNKLNVNDYAIISILEIIPMFLLGVMTFSLDQYLMRHYFEWVEKNRNSNSIYIWIISVSFGTLVFILSIIIAYFFSTKLFHDQNIFPFVILSLVNNYVICLYNIPFSLIRITNSPKIFFLIKVSTFFIYTLSIFILVYYNNYGLFGYFISLIISNLFHFLTTIIIQKNIFFNFKNFKSTINIKPTLKYVIPLVPANIFGTLIGVIERIFLQRFVPLDIIGHLSIANKFAELINQLHGILKLSYGPILFKTISSNDDSKINDFSFNTKSYIFPILFLFFFISTFSNYIIWLFDLKGGVLINDLLRLSIVFVTLNSLQIYIAPGPIITKRTGVKFLLDMSLLIILSASIFISLKYFDVFTMLIIKNIFIFLFLGLSLLVTCIVINWKPDYVFIVSNMFVLLLFLFSAFLKFNFIISLGIFITFLLINFKTLSLFYVTHK